LHSFFKRRTHPWGCLPLWISGNSTDPTLFILSTYLHGARERYHLIFDNPVQSYLQARLLHSSFVQLERFSLACCTALNCASEIMASWVSVYKYRFMRPSFFIWATPSLTVFCSSTLLVYFSLERILSIASRLHLGRPDGEGIVCFAKPFAILPRLSPTRYRSKIQRTTLASCWLMERPPGVASYLWLGFLGCKDDFYRMSVFAGLIAQAGPWQYSAAKATGTDCVYMPQYQTAWAQTSSWRRLSPEWYARRVVRACRW
jgi:hypothetical protein